MKILLTGATGFLGRPLVAQLTGAGHECHVLTRRGADPPASMKHEGVHCLSYGDAPWPQADAVINLAGETVSGRWTARRRRAVLDSRVHTTRQLVDWMLLSHPRPRVLISASAAGIYGDRPGERLDEQSPPDPKRRFRSHVCSRWEAEARRAAEAGGIRTVLLRIGTVMHPSGGFAVRTLPWLRRGLALIPGSGNEYVPWVSLADVVAMIDAARDDPRWSGAVNCTAPDPVTMREFITVLSAVVGREPIGRIPAWAIHLMLGEFGRAVLDDQRIAPRRALELGYRFIHANLAECVRSWPQQA